MVEDKVKLYLDRIKKDNKKLNAFLEVRDEKELLAQARELDAKPKKGRLYGYIIGAKSNINVLGLHASCASKTLENYESTYDATVIEKIKDADGLIIGMTNCDEFACGWSGETSAFGRTDNPVVPGHVPGGSSSGSAAAVAAGLCDVALGSDTGGSIRVPASFCGVVGVKPSYGCVSRYGLIDLSMSLDQIGPIARNVADATLVLDVISGIDEKDTKTFETDKISLKNPGKINFAFLTLAGVDERIQALVTEIMLGVAAKNSWKEKNVTLKYVDLAIQTYHPLVWTEFFSATRRMDGRRYGKNIDTYCGPEVFRRLTGGSEISKAEFEGQYYQKALQVKELIKKEFERVLDQVDCLIMPTVPILPWKFGAPVSLEQLYAVDALTIPGNLAEICGVSIPIGKIDGKPVGLQINCAKGQESKMMSIAREIELSISQ
ncbi:MAG: amidase family protein [Candidatus Pacearchaeota archaeon]